MLDHRTGLHCAYTYSVHTNVNSNNNALERTDIRAQYTISRADIGTNLVKRQQAVGLYSPVVSGTRRYILSDLYPGRVSA